MGHIITHFTCEDNEKAKRSLVVDANEWAICEGDYGNGLDREIRWINHTCDSYDEAIEYIRSHDGGWYDQIAVKFLEYPNASSKALETAESRLKSARVKYNEIRYKVHYEGVKSSYIGCKCFGSKIASAYFGKRVKNDCPICGADLRPDTVLKAIETARVAVEDCEKKYNEELKKVNEKNKKKAKVMWVAKVECHC